MREFRPSRDSIRAEAAIDIAAPPEYVAALYRDVEKWGETFAATIEQAWVIETGDHWMQVEVAHKKEGRVPNTLLLLSDTVIELIESKKAFDARFLNSFERGANAGTHFVITAYISLKGLYRLLKPLLRGYVRRQAFKQMNRYVLEPLKNAAEKEASYGRL